jgi:hypothetical protein
MTSSSVDIEMISDVDSFLNEETIVLLEFSTIDSKRGSSTLIFSFSRSSAIFSVFFNNFSTDNFIGISPSTKSLTLISPCERKRATASGIVISLLFSFILACAVRELSELPASPVTFISSAFLSLLPLTSVL